MKSVVIETLENGRRIFSIDVGDTPSERIIEWLKSRKGV